MKTLVLVLLSLLMVSCAHYSPIYWGYGEWAAAGATEAGNDLLASLDWSTQPGVIRSIDGNSIGRENRKAKGYKKAKLLAGRHVIEYADYPAEFGAHPKGTIELNLEARHSYQFRIKYCYWCIPRKYAVWVDDKTTGEVVWGKHPDWPFWWL